MPQAVTDLENTIDRVAGTLKWIKGNADTIPALKKEQWNFKSPESGSEFGACFEGREFGARASSRERRRWCVSSGRN
jgi:hypothetical protein